MSQKLFRLKYWHGMPAFLIRSSKTSLVSPTSLFRLQGRKRPERGLLGRSCQRSPGWAVFHSPWNTSQICPPGPPRVLLVLSAGPSKLWGLFLSRLNRTTLRRFRFRWVSGDRQRRPVWSDWSGRCGSGRCRGCRFSLHGWCINYQPGGQNS